MFRRPTMLACLTAFIAAAHCITVTQAVHAQQEIEQRFDKLDINRDGKLTSDELRPKAIFKALDLDSSGEITKDEATRAVQQGRLRGILGDALQSVKELKSTPEEVVSDRPERGPDAAVRQGPKLLVPGEHGIGRFVTDFKFTNWDGAPCSLHGDDQSPWTVIAMTSTSCPLSKKYLPTLIDLQREFASRGVRFILVNAVATDKADEIRIAASRFDPAVEYCFDPDAILASHVAATSTTDVIVLDPSHTVVYHGAIDDQYGFGYSTDAPRHRYLRDVLVAVLAQRPVLVAATEAPGCLLATRTAENASPEITYYNHISRLLQRNCVECHRTGGVAPFALDSLEEAVAHAPMIRQVVERGIMPPWFAATTEPHSISPWINDRSLSTAEKLQLFAWLDNKMPAGDPQQGPAPRTFADGWLIGKPDDVFEFSEPIAVKATGTMPYKNVTVETHLEQERWVQAIEIRPGNPSVVHHVLVFVNSADDEESSRSDAVDERSGYWGIYVPGNSTLVYPDGYAKRIPKGAKLRFQMHYTPNGTATEDSTRIGLVYAKQPPRHEIRVAGIANTSFRIPPAAENHSVTASIRIPSDVQILAFLPHMHLRGKAARYDWISNSDTRTLLDVPRYDFNWQLLYRYAEPLSVKAGDRLRFTAWYDNSHGNPANPDPTREVRWGPQTEDEMHLGYVEYIDLSSTPDTFAPLSARGRVRGVLRSVLGGGDSQ